MYKVKYRKIRFGLVPHIDREYFGTGKIEASVILFLK